MRRCVLCGRWLLMAFQVETVCHWPPLGRHVPPAPRMWGRARLLFTRKTLQLDLIGCGLSRIPAGTPARVARANGLLEATATYLVADAASQHLANK